jgi:hypothetical protein
MIKDSVDACVPSLSKTGIDGDFDSSVGAFADFEPWDKIARGAVSASRRPPDASDKLEKPKLLEGVG